MRATADYADAERVGADGLPYVGAVLYPGQAFYSTVDAQAGESLHLHNAGLPSWQHSQFGQLLTEARSICAPTCASLQASCLDTHGCRCSSSKAGDI